MLIGAAEKVPGAFMAAGWSLALMVAVLVAVAAPYLVRHRLERIEKSTQGLAQSRYVKHIQGPTAAVLVAAVSGYGVNSLSQESGLKGYFGLLLALPVPVFMVMYLGLREIRQDEFEEQWPPKSLLTADRVRVRFVLRRAEAEARRAGTADSQPLDEALTRLLDEALPAIRKRRDRTLRQWAGDHRGIVAVDLLWVAATLFWATLAVWPDLRHGEWQLLRVPGVIALLMLPIQAGLLVVPRRYSRYRYGALAGEVETVAGALRRQRTEHRLILPSSATRSRPRSR